ncbi:hypothetical protein DFQ26_001351 [Actinomortierella ambigua]|nr:hypothetical protein DFQ26_001351 [Actinomortierella ambigua]
MGQNTSQELLPNVPYHEKHYIENNKQLQRQSSLNQLQRQNSLSSNNLLLSREPSLKRADSISGGSIGGGGGGAGGDGRGGVGGLLQHGANRSMASLKSTPTHGGTDSNGAGTERTSSSFIRLLPIETETPYYDDDSEEEDEEEGSEEDFKEEEGEEGMLVDGHAGLHAARGDVTTVSGHNSQQTSPRHLVHKRHPHPRRHSKEDDNHDRQRLSLSSSPSDFDKAMNANSRLSRSDSLENYYHQREVLDDEQTRAEEAEDLVFLSPAQGHSFDSISSSSTSSNSQRHPSMTMTTPRSIPIPTTTTTSTNTFTSSSSASLSRSGSGSGVIRYQLHDEPVRKNLESSRAEGGLRRGVDYEEYSEDEDEDDQEEEERQRRRRGEGQDTEGVEQDEEDREDHFLRRHYASLGMNYMGESDGGGGGGGSAGAAHPPHPRGPHRQYRPVHLQNDEYSDSDDSDDSDEDVLVLDEDDEDDEDEYREVEMNQLLMEDTNQPHDIQLLSGSLSVRSPFLDSIQEEEEEEGESAFPPRAIASARLSSSVPTLSSMFMASASSTSLKNLHRLTPDLDHSSNGSNNNNNNSSSLYHHQQGRSPAQPTQPTAQGNQRTGTSPTALQPVLSERPRGPRPPIMMGRPRSNSSLTRLLESDHEASHPQDGSYSQKEDTATRPNSSMSDTVQDLEVKRVMEGHPAVADLATLAPSSSRMMNTAVTAATTTTVTAATAASTTTTATAASTAAASVTATADSGTGSRPTSVPNPSKEGAEVRPSSSARHTPTASFGQDTQRSMDEFFGAVKHDLEERIQQAIQGVEQKFLDRVHRLEERNALLAAAAATAAAQNDGQQPILEGEEGQEGSWMASLAKPLPLDQNPGGSVALRKEILNHVTEKVGDLDLRVNQMEVLVSYKLVDIESKVQDLHGAHNSIVQKVHQVAKTQSTKMTDTEAGDGLGADSIKVGEAKLETAMQPYRLAHANENNRDRDHDNGSDEDANSKALVSPRAVLELRQEVAALGTQYRDLNEGLLTDLLSQMRDAKLMLLQTVDEVDNRISKRVDRIEAEMHARLLTEIEGRVQERVRAMEQTLSRLEHCFDKTNGRLGALETTLASKQRPGRLEYQQQHQNHALQYHAGGAYRHYETIAGDGTTSSSSYHRSVTSLIFSDMDLAAESSNTATTSVMHDRPVSAPARPPLIHSDSSSPESPLPCGQEGSSKQHQHQHQQASNRAAWSSSSTTPMPTTPSEEIAHLVASPLERGTVIGGKHATIHAHDDGIHLGSGGNNRPMVGSLLTPLASSPMPSSGSKGGPVVAPVPSTMPAVGGVGGRRVSMPSLDTKSATMRDVAGGASSARGLGARTPRDLQVGTGYSTVATTTATGTARRPMKRAMSMDTNGSVGPMVGGGGVGGSLTIRPSQVVGSGSFPALVSPTGSSSSNSSGTSNTLKSPTSATSGTDLKQRLLGHGQGTKAGVKNPPSYRELLHFWKAGGSTPDLLKGV